jgi:hypothetical protein
VREHRRPQASAGQVQADAPLVVCEFALQWRRGARLAPAA